MKRSNVVRLVVDKQTAMTLRKLADVFRACWNSVNWLRMQQYKARERVDFNSTEKEVYHKFKDALKVNASQVIRKNAEAWRSFFSLSREKRDGRLRRWFRPRPPGYQKQGMILIRNDRYVVDEDNTTIYLKDFKLSLRFKGMLKWKGKQGRLEIFERNGRWYAVIPVDADFTPSQPRGDLRASVDLGIVNLATVYVEDGSWFLFKGGSALSRFEYYSKKIARVQKLLSIHKQRKSKRLSRLYEKRSRFLRHALNSMVRKLIKTVHDKGVSEIVVGYPKDIARTKGRKLTVNFWNYSYVIRRFNEVAEEYGIKVVEVDEAWTSKTCSLCGEIHESGRVKRGLFKCPHTGVINADLNGAINILHIPESQRGGEGGFLPPRDRGNGHKTVPVVYRWTNGAEWRGSSSTSDEMMRVKAVNHKPMIPKGTFVL